MSRAIWGITVLPQAMPSRTRVSCPHSSNPHSIPHRREWTHSWRSLPFFMVSFYHIKGNVSIVKMHKNRLEKLARLYKMRILRASARDAQLKNLPIDLGRFFLLIPVVIRQSGVEMNFVVIRVGNCVGNIFDHIDNKIIQVNIILFVGIGSSHAGNNQLACGVIG